MNRALVEKRKWNVLEILSSRVKFLPVSAYNEVYLVYQIETGAFMLVIASFKIKIQYHACQGPLAHRGGWGPLATRGGWGPLAHRGGFGLNIFPLYLFSFSFSVSFSLFLLLYLSLCLSLSLCPYLSFFPSLYLFLSFFVIFFLYLTSLFFCPGPSNRPSVVNMTIMAGIALFHRFNTWIYDTITVAKVYFYVFCLIWSIIFYYL